MSDFSAKIESAVAIAAEYNAAVPAGQQVTADVLKAGLLKLGVVDVATLSSVTFEDLEGHCGVPKVLARRICLEVFRSTSAASTTAETPALSGPIVVKLDSSGQKPVATANMSDEHLVNDYDEQRPSNRIGKELAERSKGAPFLAYGPDGQLNKPLSTQVLVGLRAGDSPREDLVKDDQVYILYSVGQKPGQESKENCLIPGEYLRIDGTDRHGNNWDEVPLEAQQYLRIVVEKSCLGNLDPCESGDGYTLLEAAKRGVPHLMQRFAGARVEYQRRKNGGNLPKLKSERQLPSQKPRTGSAHPFHKS